MTTRKRTAAAVIDRRPLTLLAWLALLAMLILLTLTMRDAPSRGAHAASPPAAEAADRSVATAVDEIIIVPLAAAAAPTAVAASMPPTARGDLLGIDADALRVALGAPDFVRRDGNSQMWRYGRSACTLTVFLHGQDETLTVQHVEGRGLRSLSDPSADCAERLLGERRRTGLPG